MSVNQRNQEDFKTFGHYYESFNNLRETSGFFIEFPIE